MAYRRTERGVEVLLVHPGGPYFSKKDAGSWSIPKGEFSDNEDPLQAAKREFAEETGHLVEGTFKSMSPVKLKSGKTIYAWAVEAEIDATNIASNTFEMEWPPKSGRLQHFPEVDRAEWFSVEVATEKINVGQVALLLELGAMLQQ